MELSYIRLDDRLDAVQLAEIRVPSWAQSEFQRRFLMSWLYHELSLDGLALTAGDIERALEGREGRDYCDAELLKKVRRLATAIQRLKVASARREKVTRGTLFEYQAILCGHQSNDPVRQTSGATQAYKHDVIEPDQIEGALRRVISSVNADIYVKHPLELAIATHYQLVKIWPFEEHSASVARLVANQILFTHGYPPSLIHAHDRQAYYHALHYDPRRLRALVLEATEDQITLREGLFLSPPATLERRLAS